MGDFIVLCQYVVVAPARAVLHGAARLRRAVFHRVGHGVHRAASHAAWPAWPVTRATTGLVCRRVALVSLTLAAGVSVPLTGPPHRAVQTREAFPEALRAGSETFGAPAPPESPAPGESGPSLAEIAGLSGVPNGGSLSGFSTPGVPGMIGPIGTPRAPVTMPEPASIFVLGFAVGLLVAVRAARTRFGSATRRKAWRGGAIRASSGSCSRPMPI